MNALTAAYWSVSVATLVFGVAIVARNHRDPLSRMFFLLCAINSYLAFVQAEFAKACTYADAAGWRLAGGVWPFAITVMLHFVLRYARVNSWLTWPRLLLVHAPAVVFSGIFLLFNYMGMEPVRNDVFWGMQPTPDSSGALVVVAAWATVYSLLAILIVLRRARLAANRRERGQAFLVAGGIACVIVISGLNHGLLEPAGVYTPDLSVFGFAVTCMCIGYATGKYRMFDLTIAMAAENIVDIMPDALLLVDGDRCVTSANDAAVRLAGRGLSRVIRQPVGKLFHAASLNALLDECAAGGPRAVLAARESFMVGPRGGLFPVAVSLCAVHDRDEELRGTVVIVHDLREERRLAHERTVLERQLRQAQKMEAIGQLAGGVAHDFNNLLGAILGYADIIRQKFGDDLPQVAEYADVIVKNSRRAADLTSNLLAFARKGNYQVRSVDLNATVSDVAGLMAHTVDRRITLVRNLAEDLPAVAGDGNQLHHAVLNLAVNARDAMPAGGTMTFATRTVELDEGYFKRHGSAGRSGRYVCVSVADTGVGIPPHQREKIYEPFFTTKEIGKGTGLGLASVYGTVKLHHGSIEVYSEEDRGTEFKMYLPVASDGNEETASETEQREQPGKRGSGTIMLVDDEQHIREMASEMLVFLGYNVVPFEEGEQALAFYRQAFRRIDVVLLDLVMPGMSGADCFYAIRKANPEARIIICSGYSADGEAGQLVKDGAVGFIQKPFSSVELGNRLSQILSP